MNMKPERKKNRTVTGDESEPVEKSCSISPCYGGAYYQTQPRTQLNDPTWLHVYRVIKKTSHIEHTHNEVMSLGEILGT